MKVKRTFYECDYIEGEFDDVMDCPNATDAKMSVGCRVVGVGFCKARKYYVIDAAELDVEPN